MPELEVWSKGGDDDGGRVVQAHRASQHCNKSRSITPDQTRPEQLSQHQEILFELAGRAGQDRGGRAKHGEKYKAWLAGWLAGRQDRPRDAHVMRKKKPKINPGGLP